jgi:hypothetical protein
MTKRPRPLFFPQVYLPVWLCPPFLKIPLSSF